MDKKSTKKSTIHLCSECLNEFEPKQIFIALKPDSEYYTLYCEKCVAKLKLEILRPFEKTRVKSVKKTVTKKVTVKKPVKKSSKIKK